MTIIVEHVQVVVPYEPDSWTGGSDGGRIGACPRRLSRRRKLRRRSPDQAATDWYSRRRRMRSSVGGCVENNLAMFDERLLVLASASGLCM